MFKPKVKTVEIDGHTIHVRKLSLGGRVRIQQATQSALLGGKKISVKELRARSQSGGEYESLMSDSEIDIASLFGSGERQSAALIVECVCNADGTPAFASVDAVMDLDADDADLLVRAIAEAFPADGVNVTAAEVGERAGESAATG